VRGTITFAIFGLALLALGCVGLRSLEHASYRNFELVYTSIAVGSLFVVLSAWIAISRFRYYGTVRGAPSAESSGFAETGSTSGFGDGHHCGHSGGDGAHGGDGGDGGGH